MARTRAPAKGQRGGPAQPTARSRLDIIRTVQTPLGFFVLVVLVVEAVIGGLAAFSSTSDRPYIISIMAGIVILLVVTVTALAWFRPEALQGQRVAANMPVIRGQEPELPIVKSPRVLIAGTEVFSQRGGLEGDIEAVKLLGGSPPTIARSATSAQVTDLMVGNRFDIVHFVADVLVYPGSNLGGIKFSDTDLLSFDGFGRTCQINERQIDNTCDV